jgi:hypothetical protein
MIVSVYVLKEISFVSSKEFLKEQTDGTTNSKDSNYRLSHEVQKHTVVGGN